MFPPTDNAKSAFDVFPTTDNVKDINPPRSLQQDTLVRSSMYSMFKRPSSLHPNRNNRRKKALGDVEE